jgi:hypothetical protein
MSCEKEEMQIEDPVASEEKVKPIVEPVEYKYQYSYQGQMYNEKQWDKKYATMNNQNLSMVGLNEIVYVFDNNALATNFEETRLQEKIDEAFATRVISKDATIGSADVIFKIELYDNINYDNNGNKYIHYATETVLRKRTSWGYIYLDNHEFEADLPSSMRKKTSSYRVTLIQGGTVHTMQNATGSITGNPIWLSMRFHLRAGLLSDGGRVSWSKTLYDQPDIQNRKVEKDPDFRNNRLWSAFGVTTWNDQIQSWQVEFR